MSEQNKKENNIGPDFQFMQTSDEPEFSSIIELAGFGFHVGSPSLHDWNKGEGGIRRPDYSVYFQSSKNQKYSNAPVGMPNELASTGVCEFLKKWELSYFPAWQQDGIKHYFGRDDLFQDWGRDHLADYCTPAPITTPFHDAMESFDEKNIPVLQHPMRMALQLIHPELEGVDPSDPSLSDEIKEMIVDESIRNLVYFTQVVCCTKGPNRWWVLKEIQEKKLDKEFTSFGQNVPRPIDSIGSASHYRDYFNEWTQGSHGMTHVVVDLPLKRQPQDLEGGRTVEKASSADWTDWNFEHEIHGNARNSDICPDIVEKGIMMKSNITITRPKIVETIAPIPLELLRDDGGLKYYVVNYSQSSLKGLDFLNYLLVSDVHIDVTFDHPLQYEEYSELMKAYMDMYSIVEAPALHTLMAELLLVYKQFDFGKLPYATPVPEVSFLHRFIDENKEPMAEWAHFIDSTQVLALSIIKPLKEHYDPKSRFENYDSGDMLGSNVVKLFGVPEFIVYYFSQEGGEYRLSYFTSQFEQPVFNGEMIHTYFRSRNNYAAVMFEKLAEGYFKASDVGIGIFGLGVFAPDSGLVEYDATDKY